MSRLNPIDEFEVASEELRFVNLPERYGFADPSTTYRFQWFVFDNGDGSTRELGGEADATQALPFPWIRFGLGLALAGLVLLLVGFSAGSASERTVGPAIARTVEVISVTLTGTFALVTWSFRLGRR